MKQAIFFLCLGMLIGGYIVGGRMVFKPKLISPMPDDGQVSYVPYQIVIPAKKAKAQVSPVPQFQVLGEMTATKTAEVIESTSSASLIEGSFKIALLGDSMFQTAGVGYPILAEKLSSGFKKAEFEILNYGVGARDIEYGVEILSQVLLRQPDVLIAESFAYNHWSKSKSDLDRHWLNLVKITDMVKKHPSVKLVFLATIAPNAKVYGQGIEGVTFSEAEKYDRSSTVKLYLQNLINFTVSAQLPLINVYQASLDSQGEGKLEYINSGDYLHPSPEGHQLVAEMMVDWLKQEL